MNRPTSMNDQSGLLPEFRVGQPNDISRRNSLSVGRALILAADEIASATLPVLILQSGLQPISMCSVTKLRSCKLQSPISLLLCEERLPDGNFRDALGCLRQAGQRTPMIVFSRTAEWENYLEAVRCGAYDCLRYPFRAGELQQIIRVMLEQESLSESENW